MSALLLAWSVGSAFAQPAGCPAEPAAEVERARQALWEAFRTVDELSFDRASKSLAAGIGCLDRTPVPGEVVRLHQAMALASYVNGQTKASKRSLSAVRILDPAWQLDDALFPGEHPMRDLFASATDPGPVDNLGKINPNQWVVDGIERGEAPTERAFLLQVRDEKGQTLWSGYLWDWTELPDFGQAAARSVLETPHQWWLSTGIFGGALSARQRPEQDQQTLWQDKAETAFAAGARISARYTPITVLGGEITASIAGPGDPVEGGGGLPSGHAMVLLGGAGWTGQLQPYAQVRLGFGLDRMRVWYGSPDSSDHLVQIWTVPSAIAGIGGGIRNERQRLELALDGRLAAAKIPYQVRVRLDGGVQVTGLLAVEGALDFGMGGLPLVDQRADTALGRRSDVDVRLGGGIALWR